MAQTQALTKTNGNSGISIQQLLNSDNVQKRLAARLGDNSAAFITSVLDLCGEDSNLQKCNPNEVIKECLKAAGLNLPINKNLGFAYVIPYKNKGRHEPLFQMGYRGYLQLAIRTGQYKHLNAGVIYEGEWMVEDRIKGTMTIEGEATSDTPIGFFAYMELTNGFEKAIGWSVEKVRKHAKRHSKSYGSSYSPWKTDFEAMAQKTMILQLVPKYGPMTIEMTEALSSDRSDFKSFNSSAEIEQNANQTVIDIEPEPPTEGLQSDNEITEEEKAEIQQQEIAEAQQDGPAF